MKRLIFFMKIGEFFQNISIEIHVKSMNIIERDYFQDPEKLEYLLHKLPGGMPRFRIRQRIEELKRLKEIEEGF